VGDAAGYVEPFTGEGMGWALVSARLCDEALAPLVTTAGQLAGDVATAGIRYALTHGRHFAAHHARCRRVSLVVRRPWLVGPALRLARLAPALAARVVPLVIGGAPSPEAHG
jgi:flavin-dependent dehydrogenase